MDDALVDFKRRVDEYAALHRELKTGPLKLTTGDDAAKLRATQLALGVSIQSARKGAVRGDVFTPKISEVIQVQLQQAMAGSALATRKLLREDAPAVIRLQVNGIYPEGAPVPTLPPNLLAALPALPKELEYRIVGTDLIMLDVDARLIVDILPRAIR